MSEHSSFGKNGSAADIALMSFQQLRRALGVPPLRASITGPCPAPGPVPPQSARPVQGPLLGFRAAVTGNCPTPTPPVIAGVAYTYSPQDITATLRSNPGAIAIHRGLAPNDPEIVVHRLYDEHIMLFASAVRSGVHLRRHDLANLVRGRLRRWDDLGCGSGRIRLLAHAAPINQKALLALLQKNLGIDRIAASAEIYGSYDELADSARDCDDCRLGLRPRGLLTAVWCPSASKVSRRGSADRPLRYRRSPPPSRGIGAWLSRLRLLVTSSALLRSLHLVWRLTRPQSKGSHWPVDKCGAVPFRRRAAALYCNCVSPSVFFLAS